MEDSRDQDSRDVDTQDVVAELDRFERRVAECGLAPVSETATSLVEESQRMLALLNAAEAENVAAALERDDFAFEVAQSHLRAHFDRFATLIERLVADCAAALTESSVAKLREIAFLVRRAPMASRRSLEVIRVSLCEIRKIRESMNARG